MPKELTKLALLILFVGLFSLLQAWGFLIFGARPNWALFGVIAVSFFVRDFWEALLIVAFSALILKYGSGFEKEILAFSVIAAAAIFIKKYLPWHSFMSNLLLVAFATLAFYALTDRSLILSFLFLKELILNMVLGTAFFALLSGLWQDKESNR